MLGYSIWQIQKKQVFNHQWIWKFEFDAFQFVYNFTDTDYWYGLFILPQALRGVCSQLNCTQKMELYSKENMKY